MTASCRPGVRGGRTPGRPRPKGGPPDAAGSPSAALQSWPAHQGQREERQCRPPPQPLPRTRPGHSRESSAPGRSGSGSGATARAGTLPGAKRSSWHSRYACQSPRTTPRSRRLPCQSVGRAWTRTPRPAPRPRVRFPGVPHPTSDRKRSRQVRGTSPFPATSNPVSSRRVSSTMGRSGRAYARNEASPGGPKHRASLPSIAATRDRTRSGKGDSRVRSN